MNAVTVQPLAAPVAFPAAGAVFARGRVLRVWYPPVTRRRFAWETLFNPPLDRALANILANIARAASDVAIIPVPPDVPEPPHLRGALVILSAREGEGRWPLAYLAPEEGALGLDEVRTALAKL